jgi:hypothetical protein
MDAMPDKPPLPPDSVPAWEAYRAMEATKQRHFELLERIEHTERLGGQRSFAEQVHLDRLLDEHDTAVTRFRTLMARLVERDPAARDALLAHITAYNAREPR